MTGPTTPVPPVVVPDVPADDGTADQITNGPANDYVGEGDAGPVTNGTTLNGGVPTGVPTTSSTAGTVVPTPITVTVGVPIVPPITTGPPAPVQPNPPAGGNSQGANNLKIFGREPTLWIGVISSLLIVAGTAGFHWLSGQEASLVVVAINAIAGAVNAYAVRPISPVAFTYAIGSIVAVAGAYGLNLSIETVAGINAAVIPILALLTRNQVSPQETVVSAA